MVEVRNLGKRLGGFSLSDISFTIAEGDYFVLLGRSGAGKTQLLELLAGLTPPDSGSITMHGRDITWLSPQRRNTGLVFQDFAVFPHMTTFDNIAYPLRTRKIDSRDINIRVEAIAADMNISHLLHRRTNNLSGGELQRTALARTLVIAPKLLLLDEPLASVDASLKDDISSLLRRLNRAGQTIIHVTHDYPEALSLATRVGVLHNGRLIQNGTPAEVFNRPVNRFVARYTGIRNFFRVKYLSEGGVWYGVTPSGMKLRLAGTAYPAEGVLVIRNRNVRIVDEEPSVLPGLNCMEGIIEDMIPAPFGWEVEISSGERIFAFISDTGRLPENLKIGSPVKVSMNPADLVSLGGETETENAH